MKVEHVKRKYNIQYVPHTMQRLMHDMGFSYVKPGPKHSKSALNKEKKAFKKSSDQIMTYYSNCGYKILTGDKFITHHRLEHTEERVP